MKKRLLVTIMISSLAFVGCQTTDTEQDNSTNIEGEDIVEDDKKESEEEKEPEEDKEPEEGVVEISTIEWDEDDMFAVALIDYTEDKTRDDFYNELLEKYLDKAEETALTPIELEGEEHYLIIPRYPVNKIRIYHQSLGDEGELIRGELVTEIEDVLEFTIKCNISDLHSNQVIEAEMNGETVEISPYISLQDGSLGKSEYIKDITIYY